MYLKQQISSEPDLALEEELCDDGEIKFIQPNIVKQCVLPTNETNLILILRH